MRKRSGLPNGECTLHIIAAATRESREMRRAQRSPNTNWTHVWKNLHTAWVSEETTPMWYIVILDTVPTDERLHAVRLVEQAAADSVRSETPLYTG